MPAKSQGWARFLVEALIDGQWVCIGHFADEATRDLAVGNARLERPVQAMRFYESYEYLDCCDMQGNIVPVQREG